MKKGFTLIELLGIFAVLGIMIIVTTPAIISTLKNADENQQEVYENTLKQSAELYVNANRDMYPELELGSQVSITLGTLIDRGYIKDSLTDPYTDETVLRSSIITVKKGDDGILVFEYIGAE